MVVYEVARGFSGGQEFATSINVANEDSVTGVTELGVQQASNLAGNSQESGLRTLKNGDSSLKLDSAVAGRS